MSMFSSALASGQLGPLLSQFGLPPEAVDAANRGGDTRTHTQKQIFLPLPGLRQERGFFWGGVLCQV